MSNLHKQTSSVLVTILIGFIVISFMFSGFNFLGGPSNTVAKVGSEAIKVEEFNQAYNRMLQYYGDKIPKQQLKMIQQNILDQLINEKLLIILADDIGISKAEGEIKEYISNLSYLKKDNKFNLDLYKRFLQYNRMNSTKFESLSKIDIARTKINNLLHNYPVSQNFVKELIKFKSNSFTANIITIDPKKLEKNISVSRQEIKNYLSDEKTLKLAKSEFKRRKRSFDKPAEVLASHILLKIESGKDSEIKNRLKEIKTKINTGNFAKMANQHTEDPTGKGNGGSLGWFQQGKMAPSFDKVVFEQKEGTISDPIKSPFGYHLIYTKKKKAKVEAIFDKFKNKIVTTLIQKNRAGEVKSIIAKLKSKLKPIANSNKKVDLLNKKYSFKFEKNISINKLDGVNERSSLKDESVNKIFSDSSKTFYEFQENNMVKIVSILKKDNINKQKTDPKEDLKQLTNRYKNQYARSLRTNIIEDLKNSNTIKIYMK